jgi:hypothetical protein
MMLLFILKFRSAGPPGATAVEALLSFSFAISPALIIKTVFNLLAMLILDAQFCSKPAYEAMQ